MHLRGAFYVSPLFPPNIETSDSQPPCMLLADELGSGPSGLTMPVEVQVLSSALAAKDLGRRALSPFCFPGGDLTTFSPLFGGQVATAGAAAGPAGGGF